MAKREATGAEIGRVTFPVGRPGHLDVSCTVTRQTGDVAIEGTTTATTE